MGPKHPLYYNRGNALLRLRRYVETLAEYDKAIRLSPNNPLYHLNKGFAYAVMGEVDLGFNVLADLAGRSEPARQQLCAEVRDYVNNKRVRPNVKEMLMCFLSKFCTG